MVEAQRERALRSDSIRNREAILDAAAACLVADPASSLADIARSAGVGRVTLYGHFSSRTELLTALVHHTMTRVERELTAVDLGGDPWTALDALVTSSWRLLYDLNALLGAVERDLPPEVLHGSHGAPRARVEALLARGRAEGAFRDDQPVGWQTACYFAILHGAASEIRAGHLTEADATRLLPQTLRALLRVAPGSS